MIVVEHPHGRKFLRSAAGTDSGVGFVQPLHDGGVSVLMSIQKWTFAIAEVCFIYLWRHNEVPSKVDKVDDQRASATAGLVVFAEGTLAVASRSTPASLLCVDLQQRCLKIEQ